MKVLAPIVILVSLAMPAPAHGQLPGVTNVQIVEPPDDVYIDLIVTATGWVKGAVSKSLGVLQNAGAGDQMRRAIQEATDRHGLKPVAIEDYVTVCRTRAASRSAPAERTCSMKGAEAIMQFLSARIAGDSGFVGVNVSRVPKNSTKVENAHYCIALGRKDGKWEARRNETTIDPDRCPRGQG